MKNKYENNYYIICPRCKRAIRIDKKKKKKLLYPDDFFEGNECCFSNEIINDWIERGLNEVQDKDLSNYIMSSGDTIIIIEKIQENDTENPYYSVIVSTDYKQGFWTPDEGGEELD